MDLDVSVRAQDYPQPESTIDPATLFGRQHVQAGRDKPRVEGEHDGPLVLQFDYALVAILNCRELPSYTLPPLVQLRESLAQLVEGHQPGGLLSLIVAAREGLPL